MGFATVKSGETFYCSKKITGKNLKNPIHLKEFAAVNWAAENCPKDSHVHIFCDSLHVVSAIRRGVARNEKMHNFLKKLIKILVRDAKILSISWTKSEDNLADWPSRNECKIRFIKS